MKKLITLIAVLCSGFAMNAQNEYLEHNPQWLVYNQLSQFYPCINNDSTGYYLNGDSIINSLTYKKLYAKGHVIDQWWSSNPNFNCYGNYTYANTDPTGFLRSQGQQMYFIMYNDTTEYLLYDFNLTVGSTTPQWFGTPAGLHVTSIDSFYTPYGYRKQFFLDSTPYCLIEGVGSSYGLIEPYGVMLDAVHTFLCYGFNDTAWIPQQGPACVVITSMPPTPAPPQQEVSLDLVPNPAGDYVDIHASGFSVESIIIYDVFGRVVRQEPGITKIFVGDLPSGVYTCMVNGAEMRMSKTLIVE